MAFSEWIRSKIAGGGHRYQELSQTQLRSMWNVYLTWCEAERINPLKPTASEVARFLRHGFHGRPPKLHRRAVQAASSSPTMETRRRYAKLLAMTFQHLEKLRLLRGNPVESVMPDLKPEAPPAVSFLPKIDEERLIAHADLLCNRGDWLSRRDGTLLLTLLGAGPTASEAVDLATSDVALGDYVPSINIAQHGRTQAHAAPVPALLLPRLQSWLQTRAEDKYDCDWLFPSLEHGSGPGRMDQGMVYVIVRKALDTIGFTGAQRGPHTLRNTFARRSLFNGVAPADLQVQMGLASDRTIVKVRRTLPMTAARPDAPGPPASNQRSAGP